MRITASVFINDDEPGQHQDDDRRLDGLAHHEPVSHYQPNRTGEDNADAHLRRQVLGRGAVVAVSEGRLDFGPWEQIFYGEFDGRRRKRVLVKIIGGWVKVNSKPAIFLSTCLDVPFCEFVVPWKGCTE